jgi:hypothetical protein
MHSRTEVDASLVRRELLDYGSIPIAGRVTLEQAAVGIRTKCMRASSRPRCNKYLLAFDSLVESGVPLH